MMRMIPFLLLILIGAPHAHATACPTDGVKALFDINWACMLPIRIGGTLSGGSASDDSDSTGSPVCVCEMNGALRYGLNVQMWEPARLVDTVTDPFCAMPIGAKVGDSDATRGKLGGSLTRSYGRSKAFLQMHFYQYPALQLLDLFTDIRCLEDGEFDMLMASEVIPGWQNDLLSLLIHPEAILFANPVAMLACAADSVAATRGKPINQLFWCMGAWNGSVYPLAGTATASDYVESHASIAAKSLFMMSRLGLMRDASENGCYYTYTPIWKKDTFKLQTMVPVRSSSCVSIGESGLLWSAGKHPPVGADNFMWMIFRKLRCCMSYDS